MFLSLPLLLLHLLLGQLEGGVVDGEERGHVLLGLHDPEHELPGPVGLLAKQEVEEGELVHVEAELHVPVAGHRAVRDLRQLGELLVAKTARVEESCVEELQLLLGDHSRTAASKEVLGGCPGSSCHLRLIVSKRVLG